MESKYIIGSENCFIFADGIVIGVRGRPLKPGKNRHGYLVVVIKYKERGLVTRAVHKLVAEAFLDRPDPTSIVNHKDGVKTNNHVENLEWCSYRENLVHAFELGLNPSIGESSHWATITEEQAHSICRLLAEGRRNVDICAHLGVSRSIVDQIRSGLNWKQVSKHYTFATTSRRRRLSDATARWVCEKLQAGLKPSEILLKTTCPNLTRGVIKTIQRRDAYHEITCDYTF